MAKFLYSQVHHKPKNHFALILMGFIFLILLFIGIYIYNYMAFSPRDRVVNQYIKGLRKESPILIDSLVSNEFDASKEIANDIGNYGGIWFATKGEYRTNSENGLAVDTTIYGFKGLKPIKKDITLIGRGDAWYLLMGDLKEDFREN